jgi:phosphatidylinositol glycan class Q protein
VIQLKKKLRAFA